MASNRIRELTVGLPNASEKESGLTGDRLLLLLGKIIVFGLGVVFLSSLITILVSETRLFTDPKYEGFWNDVEAYHLKRDGWKTPEELARRYGAAAVVKYVASPGLHAAYVPSENGAITNMIGYVISQKQKRDGSLIFGCVFLLIVAYLPIVIAARQTQRFLARCLFSGPRSRVACDNYYAAIDKHWIRAAIVAFVLTLILSFLNALGRLSPELSEKGVTIIDLAGAMLVLAYVGGLWMRLLLYIVDLGFLGAGSNPHLSLWDEVIAVIVMTPVLWLVYQNSWLTIVTTAAAGLASGFLVKWSIRRGDQGADNDRR